jgi:inosine-uridine nucleoside N-ribohydrolase
VKRAALFSADTPLTNATTTLYEQWTYSTNNPTPRLFDVLAVEQAVDPATCPTEPMLLTVDDRGYTREGKAMGEDHPNALVCLHPNAERVFGLLMERLTVSK